GDVEDSELQTLGKYGVSKILHAGAAQLRQFINQAYASVIAEAAGKVGATTVVVSNSFSGRGLAPRVAAKLGAALADGTVELPEIVGGTFKVKKTAFSGKAFAIAELTADKKVIALNPNSFEVRETDGDATVEVFEPQVADKDLTSVINEIVRATDKVSLADAEIVVSAGRGLKGPENWGLVEELAEVLGAATACSKPVSDAGWRPHEEHVGQTGLAISPNLYIAIGISGAIQHLAGVSS